MNDTRATRLMLVDDHDMFRSGLQQLLLSRSRCEVVAQARSAEEALKLLQANPDLVDVAVVDIGLAGMNGLAATAEIRRLYPHVQVVVLSMYKDEEYLARALKAGASAYVLKEAGIEELLVAIEGARQGHIFVSPAIAHTLVKPFLQSTGEGTLTPRQVQVLQLFAKGLTTRQVAQRLELSPKTVETHRAQLMERLGLRSVAALVLYAVRQGYIRADEAPAE